MIRSDRELGALVSMMSEKRTQTMKKHIDLVGKPTKSINELFDVVSSNIIDTLVHTMIKRAA